MSDPVRNYIRRSRPELASYRSRKSFWEKLADGDESITTKKKPVSVPTFGEIRNKFNESNQRRSRHSKNNEAEKNESSQMAEKDKELPTSIRQKDVSPTSDGFSRKSARRRSLEKPKSTFLHMTEVMEGYVPSDTDSVASSKDKSQNAVNKSNGNYRTSQVAKVTLNLASDKSSKKDTAPIESVSGKQSTTASNDGSFRKKNRIRRRGSGKEARFDAVKKEDIVSARIGPVTNATNRSDKDVTQTKGTDSVQKDIGNDGVLVSKSPVHNDNTLPTKLQRQDSGDNPMKRKRDRKSHKLKLSSPVDMKDPGKNGETSSPQTPSYESKSVLSGIQLSSPRTPPGRKQSELKSDPILSDDRTASYQQKAESPVRSPSLSARSSPKRQYESVFMGRKRNLINPVNDSEVPRSDNVFKQDHSGRKVKETSITNPGAKIPQSIDVDDYSAADSAKASDGVDSSTDTAKASDTIDLNCTEQRWSTIDSGISVACALQQNADANKATQVTVQSTKHSADTTAKIPRQRRYRRLSTSSSDSDDDSGISWDELRDFRDVPLVVVDEVSDPQIQEQASNVKIELENSLDKGGRINTDGFSPRKSKTPSAIGSRINQKWNFRQEDESDGELESDQPLRTSTPTGSRVSVVLEPNALTSKSVSNFDTNEVTDKGASLVELNKISTESHKSNKALESTLQTPAGRADAHTRPSRLSRFLASNLNDVKVPTSNELESSKETLGDTQSHINIENKESNESAKIVRNSSGENKTQSSPTISKTESFFSSPKDRVRSKSETSEPSFFQVRSRSLTRQLSPLDPMEDVLTKRSPFRVPSSLSNQNASPLSNAKRRIPSVSQYQRTHTHSRTDYNMQPPSLHRAKSNPILYEPPIRTAKKDDHEVQKSIKPVIRARESSLPRLKANPPPVFTPAPPQPTSLASRLLPQRRRSLHRSIDIESDSSLHTPYTIDDDEGHTNATNNDISNGPLTNGHDSGQKFLTVWSSLGTTPSSGVFSESDQEEQTPRKSIAPSLRLREKVRSRTSSVSSRPMDMSFSDSECVDGNVVVRKHRRSRSRSRVTERTPESNINASESNINVQVTSTAAGDRKIDTLDSRQRSQARRQMSLSKTHRTSSKHVDKESDLDDSLNDEQWQGNLKGLKHFKDRNNNMISKQNKPLLSLEQLAEEEIISSASKLQIDLYKHKKHFEKDLSKKLESAMEESDNLVGALRKSMNEPRAKDKVKEAIKNVNEVIKFDIIRDYRAKLQWYKVQINLGSYTQNVDARKTSNYRVTVSCGMPDGPKFSKDIHLDFPESVDLSQLEILQVGDDLELRVPFTTWNPPPSMDNVIEKDGGNPKDTFTRIGFLEKAYHSMGLQWPPDGATAHYEYLSTRGGNDSQELTKRPKKPPEYQSLLESGQLKACAV